ncbi:MAG: hypothetical protein JW744_05585, partial [Candidatus Diapherotrites archaeon]|nr:hypothetical protein [Candidatus Diapherotrites archaeon]
ACFLLLLPAGLSISSQEALDFVSKQNSLLYSNETIELFPNVKIRHSSKDYFVVAVLSNESLSGFIPVLDKSPAEIPESLSARRDLVKTAYSLRHFQLLKESAAQQGQWIFDAKNVKFFSDLSNDLKNERVDLTTVETELSGYASLQLEIAGLRAQLEEMYPAASSASSSISGAISFESDYLSGPDTNKLSRLQSTFNQCFDEIQGLDSMRSDYVSELDKVMQAIALSGLPIETKQGLNNLLSVPTTLQQLSLKADTAIVLDEEFNKIFANAQSGLGNFVDGLSARESRNSAFQSLYGSDDGLLAKTGQQSLSNLVEFILLPEYVYKWNKQGSVESMQLNWLKAETFYNSGSFEEAENYAGKARDDAIRVYEAGLFPGNGTDTDLLFAGAIILIIALIILFAVKNRQKLMSLVSGGEEEEGKQLYDFEK